MSKKELAAYQNNPILIGLDGLQLTFRNAKNIGIYSIALSASLFVIGLIGYILSVVADMAYGEPRPVPASDFSYPTTIAASGIAALVALIISSIIVYMAVALLLFGVTEYTAAQLAKGKRVGLGEAFKEVLRQFPSYFFVYVIVIGKVLLWSLLLIVPGFIMANRYILAGTVFFAEGKKGNAAVKRSAELTKGAWLTTYGGVWIWNIISQGLATFVFWPGQMAILYKQLAATTDSNTPKPPAHILSWLTLLVPIGLLVLWLMFVIFAATLIGLYSTAP